MRRRFEASPSAIREARAFLQSAVAGRLDPEVESDLVLVMSELASNAVRHAQTPFEVAIEVDDKIRIEVEDGSLDAPVPTAPTDTGGRGLAIIELLCDSWGVGYRGHSKYVWCERGLSER